MNVNFTMNRSTNKSKSLYQVIHFLYIRPIISGRNTGKLAQRCFRISSLKYYAHILNTDVFVCQAIM